ncbi:hypothetical protein ACFLZ2_04255 [Candidatus Margulisiibacteriota bacterium]
MKRLVCVLVSLLVLSIPSLAIGPLPITLYGGLSGPLPGTVIGANAALSLPLLPGLGVELESGSGTVNAVNYTTTRIGFMYKGFMGLFNLSYGTETLNFSSALSELSIAFPAGNIPGTYIGLGTEIGIMSFVINPRLVMSSYAEGMVPWINLTIGYKF